MIKHIGRSFKLVFAIVIFITVQTGSAYAQQDSLSLRRQAGRAITERFPTTRFINVEYQNSSSVNYRIETRDKSLKETKIKEQNRVKVDINAPLFRYKDWTFTGSAYYNYTHFALDDASELKQVYPNFRDSDLEGHLFNTALNSTYISTLFDKPVIYNIGVSAEFSQDGFERMVGMGIATFVLQRNARYMMTAGAVVRADLTTRFPIIPFFGIDYKIADDWQLSFILPQYAYIRKSFSKSTRLSLGSNLRANQFYVHPSGSDKSYLYSKAEINTGLVFEHYVNQHFILTARGGMVNALKGNLTQRNKSYSKRLLNTSQDAGMYFNVGFSYTLY